MYASCDGHAMPVFEEKEKLLTKVEVDFFYPQSGVTTETYDLTNPNDLFCWQMNCKKTAFIQLRVREVGFSDKTDELVSILKAAKVESKKLFENYKKDF